MFRTNTHATITLLPALLLSVCLVLSCGGLVQAQSQASEEEAVQQLVQTFYQALAEGNVGRLETLIASPLRASLSQTSGAEHGLHQCSPYRGTSPAIREITLNGEEAAARVIVLRGENRLEQTLLCRRTQGTWQIVDVESPFAPDAQGWEVKLAIGSGNEEVASEQVTATQQILQQRLQSAGLVLYCVHSVEGTGGSPALIVKTSPFESSDIIEPLLTMPGKLGLFHQVHHELRGPIIDPSRLETIDGDFLLYENGIPEELKIVGSYNSDNPWLMSANPKPMSLFLISSKPMADNRDVVKVSVGENEEMLRIGLSDQAGERVSTFTRQHVGNLMVVTLDEKALSVARLVGAGIGNNFSMAGHSPQMVRLMAAVVGNPWLTQPVEIKAIKRTEQHTFW